MMDREKRTRIEIAVGLDTPALTPAELAGLIDHTYLKAFGDAKDLERLCAEKRYPTQDRHARLGALVWGALYKRF